MHHELQWIARATGARDATRAARVQSLWSGYGEVYRVQLAGRGPAVVKSVRPPPRPATDRSHRRKCRSYDVELAWYQRYAPRSPARVPRLLAGRRAAGRWLVVLEDLDAAGFAGRCGRVPDEAELDRCLAWLAAFHARFLGVAPAGLWATGTYWHLATRPDELAALDDAELRAAAPRIDQKLRAGAYPTLVHGDAKPANFCVGDRGVAAVDFQYVGGGCGMSDVAYLLSCCDPADEPRGLDRYFVHLRAALAEDAVAARVDPVALEQEWRGLYPFAAADFYRFYAGWAKARWAHERAGQRVVREVLRAL